MTFSTRVELRSVQDERLRALMARAWDVPFWRRKLTSAGLAPDDVKTVDDLVKVPRTTKDELRASEASCPPWGDYRADVAGAVRVGTSTGTSGQPTVVLWTRRDLDVECEAAARMFSRLGLRPGATVAHAHPLGLYGGGFLHSEALERFGCLAIALGTPDDPERLVRFLQRVRPDVYQLFPNVALLLWETAERMGVDPRSLNLRYPKQRPAAQYASASAGIECLAYLGSACREFNGAHVAEDMCIVEVVDPVSGEPVPDGVRGHLVCTSIAKDNFLLRYDLEDVVRMDASPCACGEASARLWWEGRASEIVRAGGRDVLPIDVWNAVGTPTFQIVRGSPPRIRVELDEAPPVEGFVVECVPRGTLERPEFKPVRVVEEA